MSPVVSIITPLHNKGEYIAETLSSVMSQTLPDWEMIIVENGSNDNGPEIAQKFVDPRIRVVVAGKTGPGAARNYGLTLATGEWILFLDADDLLTPDYLESRLSHARIIGSYSDSDIIVGGWEEFSSLGSARVLRRPSGEHGGQIAIEVGAIAAAPWAVHAALIRYSLLDSHSWPEDLDDLPSEDTAFWYPLIRKSHITVVPEYGALYRIPEHLTRNRPKNLLIWLKAIIAVVKKNTDSLIKDEKVPSPAQCAVIMRVFESIYCRALALSDQVTAGEALNHAKQWLVRCRYNTGSIIIRKILGIRIFCKLKNLFKARQSI
jgi:Glycosyl transferase family 2